MISPTTKVVLPFAALISLAGGLVYFGQRVERFTAGNVRLEAQSAQTAQEVKDLQREVSGLKVSVNVVTAEVQSLKEQQRKKRRP